MPVSFYTLVQSFAIVFRSTVALSLISVATAFTTIATVAVPAAADETAATASQTKATSPLLTDSDLRLLSYEQNGIGAGTSGAPSAKFSASETELVQRLERAAQELMANSQFHNSAERFEQLISIWQTNDQQSRELLERMLKIGALNPKIYETRRTQPPLHYKSARALISAYESALRYAAQSPSPEIRERALQSLTALVERTQGDPIALERMGQWISISDWTRYQTSPEPSTRSAIESARKKQTPSEISALQKLNAAYETSYQFLKSSATCFELYPKLK